MREVLKRDSDEVVRDSADIAADQYSDSSRQFRPVSSGQSGSLSLISQELNERKRKRKEGRIKESYESETRRDMSGEFLTDDEKLLLALKNENIQLSQFRKMRSLVERKESLLVTERKKLKGVSVFSAGGGCHF